MWVILGYSSVFFFYEDNLQWICTSDLNKPLKNSLLVFNASFHLVSFDFKITTNKIHLNNCVNNQFPLNQSFRKSVFVIDKDFASIALCVKEVSLFPDWFMHWFLPCNFIQFSCSGIWQSSCADSLHWVWARSLYPSHIKYYILY